MKVSFSSISHLFECPLSWLNQQEGLDKEEFSYFLEGREAHRIIQNHISCKKPVKELSHLRYKFEKVEEVDFDEKMKFEIPIGNHTLIGYIDADSPSNKMFGEIKPNWNLKKFITSYQRKIYTLARPDYTHCVLFSYAKNPLRVSDYIIPIRPNDRVEALEWVKRGIEKIENMEFEPNPEANCFRCVYRLSCLKSKYKETHVSAESI